MSRLVHVIAAVVATACIATFWISTAVAELFLAAESVVRVKQLVVQGLAILIPALVMTGASGARLARGRSGALITRKRTRMKVAAFNGLAILVPSAFYLRHLAEAGMFDATFVAVQLLELAAGGVNLWLLALNARDGARLVVSETVLSDHRARKT